MKKLILIYAVFALFTSRLQAQTVTDIDGHVYHTITIGTQVWMKENLRVQHYLNGDSIPYVTDPAGWSSASIGHYCYYNNDPLTYDSLYGGLYNYNALIDNRGLCPINWHVPTNAEWNILEKYLDNTVDTTLVGWTGTNIGGILKDTGTLHWQSPNFGATDSIGFRALPGGYRDDAGNFLVGGTDAGFWSSTMSDASNCWGVGIDYNGAQIIRNTSFGITGGFSVRLIYDFASGINHNHPDKNIQIYPNPATDVVYINIKEARNTTIQIYNILGECVYQSQSNKNNNAINISILAKGIYILQLTDSENSIQKKLIKE